MSSGKPQESAAPSPCAKGCGFFGSAATRGMCSVCFKKHCAVVSEEPAAGATSTAASASNKAVDALSAAAAATVVIKPVAQDVVPPPEDVVPALEDRGHHEQPQESGASSPCATGCGFFGNAATRGMCSVCFKKRCVVVSEEPAADATSSAAAASNKAVDVRSAGAAAAVVINPAAAAASAVAPKTAVEGAAASAVSSSPDATEASKDVPDAAEAAKKAWKDRIVAEWAKGDPWANKCTSCFKKLGLMRFVCRCGKTYCGTHRHPEEHACAYDYVGIGRAIIAHNNPVIKGDKLRDKI